MRALLFFLLVGILLIGCSTNTLFDDELREFVEFLRLQMHCGYEPAGIPPLAPYETDFKELKVEKENWDIRANFSDLTITGLDGFDVRVLQYNNPLLKVSFDVNFEKILAKGNYMMDLITRELGAALHIFGDGDMQLALENVHARGSFKFFPTTSGSVRMIFFRIKLDIGAVHSEFTGIQNSKLYSKVFNSWVEEFLQLLVNDNPTEISSFLQSLIVPPINQAMKNISIVKLIKLITGLAGDAIPSEAFC